MNPSAQRVREPQDQPVQSAYSRVAVFSHSPAALFLCSDCNRRIIRLPGYPSNTIRCGPPPCGEKGLRSHPHASRRAIYARSCIRSSQNSPYANIVELRKSEVRRKPILGTRVNNEATSPTLRVDVAGAIIVHSLSSFLEGRERRGSPQSRLLSRFLFPRSRTYTPPAPHPPSPCIFAETPEHPARGPP